MQDAFGGSVVIEPTSASLPPPQQQQQVGEPAAAAGDTYEDLLGFASDEPASVTVAPPSPPAPSVALNPNFTLDGGSFQSMWQSLPEACSSLSPSTGSHTPNSVEDALRKLSILTMASGETAGEIKLFLYCQEEGGGGVYLVQVLIDKNCEPRVASVTVKTKGGKEPDTVMGMVHNGMGTVGF